MSFATVSLVSSPLRFEPVNTDGLWFNLLSGSYSEPGFKYVFMSYCYNLDPAGVTQSLGTNLISPRPVDGAGIFTPHKLLKTRMINKYLSNIDLTGAIVTYNGMLQYWMDYGFQMTIDVPYYDFQYVGGTFGISFTQSQQFAVGDVIYVNKLNTKINPTYGGFQTVTNVWSPTFITTDKTYTGVNSPAGEDGGTITSLNRITNTTYVGPSASGSKYCWNANKQYEQKYYDFSTEYVLSNMTQSFLTYYENDAVTTRIPANMKSIRTDQYEVVSFISNGASQSITQILVNTYDRNNNAVVNKLSTLSPFITEVGKYDIGIGPMNLKTLFSDNTMFNGAYFYRVTLWYDAIGPGAKRIATINRKIDDSCTVFDVIQMRFLNRLGGYECYNFIRNSKQTLNIERKEWRSELAYDYQIGARQQNVLSQVNNTTWVANTDFLSQYDYNFLQELISSPEVYRMSGTYSIPVVITDSSWVQKTYNEEQIFNLTISFKDAFNVLTQDN
jgi:hypothetical protein